MIRTTVSPRTLALALVALVAVPAPGCALLVRKDDLGLSSSVTAETRAKMERVHAARQRVAKGPVDEASAAEFAASLAMAREDHLWNIENSAPELWNWQAIEAEMIAAVEGLLPALDGAGKTRMLRARAAGRLVDVPALDDLLAAYELTPSLEVAQEFFERVRATESGAASVYFRRVAPICKKVRPQASTPEEIDALLMTCLDLSEPRAGKLEQRLAWASTADLERVRDLLPKGVDFTVVNRCPYPVEIAAGSELGPGPADLLGPGETLKHGVAEGVILFVTEPVRGTVVRLRMKPGIEVVVVDKGCGSVTVR